MSKEIIHHSKKHTVIPVREVKGLNVYNAARSCI